MEPTFFVIGAAKCGTTTLCDLLAAHPEVFVTDPKEPHYFSRITTFEKKRSWYEGLFAGAGGSRARGEGSTSYSHPHRIDFVAPRLASHAPAARLIYMVRHPVRRLESDWKMRTLEGRVSGPIGAAVEGSASLLTHGLYWRHLSVYREHFPDEQILVVFLEDLARSPEAVLEQAYAHLGVDASFSPPEPDRRTNTADDRRRAAAAARIKRVVPGIRRLKPVLPEWIVDSGLDLVAGRGREIPEPTWDPDALRAVVELVQADARRLLEYAGKPGDFWSFAEGQTAVPPTAAGKRER